MVQRIAKLWISYCYVQSLRFSRRKPIQAVGFILLGVIGIVTIGVVDQGVC
jgi:hypothetical protein